MHIHVRVPRMLLAIIGATSMVLVIILLSCRLLLQVPEKDEPAPPDMDQGLYGQLLPWSEVGRLFPRGGKAVVVDMDSGISFQVQRRGGSSHADAQPLTAADTAAMKQAYSGQWSWKRRAVIVVLPDGTRIAASMAGMPHGQGAIPGNDFAGHFCIHFHDSKTHGSRRVDPAHQMMVWKASGTLTRRLEALDREEAAALLFIAIDQSELNIARRLLYPDIGIEPVLLQLQRVERIRCERLEVLPGLELCADVRLLFIGTDQELRRKSVVISVYGDGPPWRITASSLARLLEPAAVSAFCPADGGWYSGEDWES